MSHISAFLQEEPDNKNLNNEKEEREREREREGGRGGGRKGNKLRERRRDVGDLKFQTCLTSHKHSMLS